VIHNYRWRLGLADGEAEYDELERRLAEGPVITVPAITLEGDANGAPHPDPSAYAGKFSGTYSHRTIEGGVGHSPSPGSAGGVRRCGPRSRRGRGVTLFSSLRTAGALLPMPVVSYESGEALKAAHQAGFGSVGDLAVWMMKPATT